MPLTRTRLKPRATAVSRASRSPGVHTTPRTKTCSPLTQRSSESADLFSTVRVPVRLGVPWVCGHQVPCRGLRTRGRPRWPAPSAGRARPPAGPARSPARGPGPGCGPSAAGARRRPSSASGPAACAAARRAGRSAGAPRPAPRCPRTQRAGDVDRPALEHRTTRRHDRTVDQDVPDRGDAADLEAWRPPGRPRRRARPTRAGRRPRPDPARG